MPSKFGDQTKQQPHVPVTQADKFDAIRDLPVSSVIRLLWLYRHVLNFGGTI